MEKMMATKPNRQSAKNAVHPEKPAETTPVEKHTEDVTTGEQANGQAAATEQATAETETSSQTQSDSPTLAVDDPAISHIVISAKIDGFRRAGRAWSRTSTTLPFEAFNDEQIEALVDEPMLDVHFIVEGK